MRSHVSLILCLAALGGCVIVSVDEITTAEGEKAYKIKCTEEAYISDCHHEAYKLCDEKVYVTLEENERDKTIIIQCKE